MYKLILKRFFDICASFIAIIILSPIFIFIFILLRLKMKGPVFFTQRRTGYQMKYFTLYKFRTMIDAPNLNDNERITNIGHFLRRSSLDELPQLFNLLIGNMSLIGPRPLLPEYDDHYNVEQRLRFSVRPGISGLAQVNGRNELEWAKKFDYDIYYVRNLSFMLDMSIILKTMFIVLLSSGFKKSGENRKFSDL